ncbi:MAG: hypothetical protein C4K49_05560 [Candidatus Thorarchaeota archaeon]|nr:MAG: hypothetical protein C4K49_05560 [Candidatus Thorarchaeota archaeon]
MYRDLGAKRVQMAKRKKDLSTMTPRVMFSLWWQEKWVRYLVFSLAPIGLVDAVYTVLLWHDLGAAFEFNPLVRYALNTEWWVLWFIIDIVSFSLFAMIAGSYYLHTRSRIFGNRINWLAALVGFRIGAAAYNILLFYGNLAAFTPAVIAGIVTALVLKVLLGRTEDISKVGFKVYWRSRYDSLRDRLLKRGTKAAEPVAQTHVTAPAEPLPRDSTSLWLKRAGYLSIAALVFVSAPFFLVMVADLTGANTFSEIFGPYVFFNELSSNAFLAGFLAVIILTAAMMFFILKAFSAKEGTW